MKKWEIRENKLLVELKKQGKLSVEEIKVLLKISESTVRRMIIELEEKKMLIRCFGGVQSIQASAREYSYEETKEINLEAKKKIGEYAAGLVEEDDVIYLSGGSTLKYMAVALCSRIERGELKNISIVTNSLVSSEILADKVNVIMPGGSYRKKFQDLAGSITEKSLRNMCFYKAFLGVVGISEKEGFMVADIDTNSIMEAIMSKASESYVLADAEKFGKNSFISYARVKDAKEIITDDTLSQSQREQMEAAGASVICLQQNEKFKK